MRLLEESDSQDLKCTDDRGLSQAFATLVPPDCGIVKPRSSERCRPILRQKEGVEKNLCKVPVR